MKSWLAGISLRAGLKGPLMTGELGDRWGRQGTQHRHTRWWPHWRRSPCPPEPHLLRAAWPNKPSLFGVTFEAVPTGSHTSPNPAKICAKLNQSILEMALVRFCQSDRLQGTERSGGAIRTWRGGARILTPQSLLQAAVGGGGAHSPTSPCEGGSPRAVCIWGWGGGRQVAEASGWQWAPPHSLASLHCSA